MNAGDRRSDILIGLLLAGIAALIGWQSARIPKGVFDPIGSGQVPLVLSAILLALALWIVLRATWAARAAPAPAPDASRPVAAAVLRGAGLAGVVLGYCLTLEFRVVAFELATFLFVVALGLIIRAGRPTIGTLGVLVVLGVALGFGVKAIFTDILYLSLP